MTESLWRDHIVDARWFQGKGLALGQIRLQPLPWYVEAEVAVRSELATMVVGETTQTYHLLVGYLPVGEAAPDGWIGRVELPGRGLVDVVDAPRNQLAMKAFLGAIQDTSVMCWYGDRLDPDLATQVLSGEQSNTTVQVGNDVLFKFFRRMHRGPNPEPQVLAGLADSPIVPHLVGTLSSPDGAYDLGVACQRIHQAQDGYTYCVEACQAGRGITAEMADLGRSLRQLHCGLAEAFGSSSESSAVIANRWLAHLDQAAQRVPELNDRRQPLTAILTPPAQLVQTQRIHGDFHLGQTLISPSGWTIIDFEGEPLKPIEQRCTPDAVWRDVAGLTRSLDYARNSHPDPDGSSAKQWYAEARNAFLQGYLDGVTMPKSLLTAYETDKAIYEWVYELGNRPDWVAIPRAAVLAAID